jgi:hypothetical protein
MRQFTSALGVALALAFAPAAAADDPASVYSDYAEDGVLSCTHSKAALKGALRDARLNQYGDPYTLIGLRLAVRKQLAGGCRQATAARRPPAANGVAGPDGSTSARPAGASRNGPQTGSNEQGDARAGGGPRAADAASGDPDGDSNEGMTLLAVALLVIALATGGWAIRRAFKSGR